MVNSSLVLFNLQDFAFCSDFLTFHLSRSAWALAIFKSTFLTGDNISKYGTHLMVVVRLRPLCNTNSSEALNFWLLINMVALVVTPTLFYHLFSFLYWISLNLMNFLLWFIQVLILYLSESSLLLLRNSLVYSGEESTNFVPNQVLILSTTQRTCFAI